MGQRTEEITSRLGRTTIQLLVQVSLQRHSLGTSIPEYVNAPPNPQIRLGFGNVEQVSHGPRLNRQGELPHHFDGLVPHGLQQHSVNERLDLRHHLRVFGALKKRLNDPAIIGVVRRVCLHGQLPHRAHIFLGGNRDAEGRIRAVGLPVAGRLPNLLVTKNHGHGLALEVAGENAILTARLNEGIRSRVHGRSIGPSPIRCQRGPSRNMRETAPTRP